MPRPTVHDDLTLAKMLAHGFGAIARCNTCHHQQPVDLEALITKVGPDYCLYNKRTRCRRKDCTGWVRFFWAHGWGMGMWSTAQADRWFNADWEAELRADPELRARMERMGYR